ncbi:translocation/assembly module TamB domain-containing protein [Oceanicella actignis]|uniref:Translocation and assembly module TamB n=1 Tax=Oceanicella actignis TaxID=1189325 RepID=A0A1M7TSC8_9RHOB|nr:translocation/assembly module TamB domain-containing protein [Oceanicella actignis]SET77030.1 autotransporter secretion inner membrane protein TamB [Oceanicella actignis]SHN73578.1 translocation and assembly module TamB [Oceanicella actignis]
MTVSRLARLSRAALVGAALALAPPPPAGAQISILGLKNSLVQFALSQLSTPGSLEITAEGVAEPEDGVTELRGLAVADAQGVWLRAEAVGVSWSPSRLLSGELAIRALTARGVEVLRRPVLPPSEAPAKGEAPQASGGGWPRAPLTVVVDALTLSGVRLAPGVAAAQGVAFDAQGAARDEGDVQALELRIARTDAVEGVFALRYARDFAADTLRVALDAREGPGGLAAEYAGLGAGAPSRLKLDADGPLSNWRMTAALDVERVLSAHGSALADLEAPVRFEADFVAAPGPDAPPEAQAALAPQAALGLRVAEGADGVIRIERARLAAPALDARAAGFYRRADRGLELDLSLEARRALAALVPGVDFARLGFDGRLSGSADDLTASGAARLEGLASHAVDAASARLEVTGRLRSQDGPQGELTLQGAATGVRLDRLTPDLIGPARLSLQAAHDGRRATVKTARFSSSLLEATASGVVALSEGAHDLTYALDAPDIAPIARAYGREAAGRLSATGALGGAVGAARLTGEAVLSDAVAAGRSWGEARLTHDVTIAEGVAGRAALSARGGPIGPVDAELRGALRGVRLTLDALSFEGLRSALEGRLDADLDARLAEGALRFEARDLSAFEAFADLFPQLAGAGLGGAVSGTLELSAPEGRQAATLRAQAQGARGFGAAIEAAELAGWARDLFGAPEGGLTAKAQGLRAGDAALSALDAGAELAQADGAAALTLRADAPDLRLAGAAARGLRLRARADDALGAAPRLEVSAGAGGAAMGAVRLGRLEARASGALDALDVRFDAEGDAPRRRKAGRRPLFARLAARLDLSGEAPAGTLTRLEAGLGKARARLRAPARIESAGGVTALRGLDLALPGGRLRGDLGAGAQGATGDVTLNLPRLVEAARLAGAPIEGGALRARARFDTRPGKPFARIRLNAEGLDPAGVEAEDALDAEARLDWDGGEATARASLSGRFGEPVVLRARARARPAGVLPALEPGAPIEARASWKGRLGAFWGYVPAPAHVLDGDLDLDLGVKGPPGRLRPTGRLVLTNGQYQNLDLGTILTGIEARTRVGGGADLTLDLRATDGSGAPLSASLTVDGQTLRGRLSADGAILVRRDDVTAKVSLDLTAAGPLSAPLIAGEAVIDRAEVRLVNALPPSVADLGEVAVKGAPPPEEDAPPPADSDGPQLDLRVRAPGGVFVRGRGLDSEWEADLSIKGPAADPIVVGAVERRRGELDLLGKTFELTRGRIAFSGARPPDPALDVALWTESDDIEGGIVVSGTASAPQVSFASRPALPEEEVMPRLLFGTSRQSLSASQALQLATGLATLLNGEAGLLDGVRGALGVDMLSVDQSGEETAVRVGKSLADGVFVGARQPLDGGPASVEVEVELFDGVSATSEAGGAGGASVGLRWKKDF